MQIYTDLGASLMTNNPLEAEFWKPRSCIPSAYNVFCTQQIEQRSNVAMTEKGFKVPC